MPEIAVGLEDIVAMLVGEMGIKDAILGDETLYTRQGGYFYIELDTSQNNI